MRIATGMLLMAAGAALVAYGMRPSGHSPPMDATDTEGDVAERWATSLARPAFRLISDFSAPVVVTLARPSGGAPSPAPDPKSVRAPADRDTLARELQKELKRAGCYDGELNGIWTPTTRAAMKSFTGRVNASLPVDIPDPILLTLVKAYPDKACGMTCPAGQGLGQDGRCLPNAILSQAVKGTKRASGAPAAAITGWTTTTTAATPAVGPAPEGRMALDGPSPDVVAPPAPPPATAPVGATPAQRIPQGAGDWANSILRSNKSFN